MAFTNLIILPVVVCPIPIIESYLLQAAVRVLKRKYVSMSHFNYKYVNPNIESFDVRYQFI